MPLGNYCGTAHRPGKAAKEHDLCAREDPIPSEPASRCLLNVVKWAYNAAVYDDSSFISNVNLLPKKLLQEIGKWLTVNRKW